MVFCHQLLLSCEQIFFFTVHCALEFAIYLNPRVLLHSHTKEFLAFFFCFRAISLMNSKRSLIFDLSPQGLTKLHDL